MMIPGAYEPDTLTRRQTGAMTGAAYGTDGIDDGAVLIDAATRADREREGGGGPSQRPPPTDTPSSGVERDATRPNRRLSWLRSWRFAHR
jgi:hypothetical protein